MSINLLLRNFFLYISSIDFNQLFYDGNTGKNISFQKIFPSGKYSIIGNSPISLEKRNGSNIDKSDYVIRFNNFQIFNYETYIGKKTNVWVTGGGQQSPNHLPICLDQKTMKKVFIMNKNMSFKEKQLHILNKYGVENISSFIIFHNEDFLNKVITLIQGIPTTGFLIILLLTAKYKNIDTYGFSFGSYKQKYHYYKDFVKQDYGHRWQNELKLFKGMVIKKLINNYDMILNNVQNIRYSKNVPRHIKQLYEQRNIQNKIIKKQKYTNQFYQLPYSTYLTNKITNNVIKNNSNKESLFENKRSITEDTNNKILEIHKILNNI